AFFISAQAVSRCRERRRELMAREPVRSPSAAHEAARSNWSVTFAIALTITTGCLPMATRPATMAAVRPMAAGSSTDVPPNFITTRLMPIFPSFPCRTTSFLKGCGLSHWAKFLFQMFAFPRRLKPRSFRESYGTAEAVPFQNQCHLSVSGARSGLSNRFKLAQAHQQLGVEDGRSGRAAHGVVRKQHELPVKQVAGAQPSNGDRHAVAAVAIQARLGAVGLRCPLHGDCGGSGQIAAGQWLKLSPGRQNLFLRGFRAQFEGDALGVAVHD